VKAALLVALCAACGEKADVIDWLRMKDQTSMKALPYGGNPFFADGRTMRAPPAGTVPREREVADPMLASGLDEAGAYAKENPFRLDAELLERGRDRFEITCAACHGLVGDGDSEVARAMRLRKPPSLHEARIAGYPPGRIYQVVTQGFGLMPSYRTQLGIRDRWAVVAYVRALQLSQDVKLAALPADIRDEAQRSLAGGRP
jgi:mono/diheme cytochrome c family protein